MKYNELYACALTSGKRTLTFPNLFYSCPITMTVGLDLVAAVVGVTDFFSHVLNRLRKLINMSQSLLKLLFDSSDFHKHFQYLATNHRVNLAAQHGNASPEVTFLDKCTDTCKETYDRLQLRLLKVQDSRCKVYRAFREKDGINELTRLAQKSNSDLSMVVSMTGKKYFAKSSHAIHTQTC